MTGRPRVAVLAALFFVSGSTALVYQVVWARRLGLFLGNDVHGVAVVLGTFMGGLAVGAFVGGKLADHVARPLAWYGAAELGIGAYALAFGAILDVYAPALRVVYAFAESHPVAYLGARVLLAVAALLLPTALMGSTLPFMVRYAVRERATLGRVTALLYATNSLGAVTGALAVGFMLLPHLGVSTTTAGIASANLALGALCVLLGVRSPLPAASRSMAKPPDAPDTVVASHAASPLTPARITLLASAASGLSAFALEVIWTRILIVTFSGTVYSFASMLVTFLLGISLGSFLVSRRLDRRQDHLGLFAILQLGAAAALGVLGCLLNWIPGFFARVLMIVTWLTGGQWGDALAVSTLLVSVVVLAVPVILLGAAFPVALRAYATALARIGTRTGNLFLANTLGGVAGALLASFVLIPWVGGRTSLAVITLVLVATGLVVSTTEAGPVVRRADAHVVAVLLVVAVAGAIIGPLLPQPVTMNFARNERAEGELVYHAESAQNTIDIVRASSGATSLIVNGIVEASDSGALRWPFVVKAHLPLVFLDAPRSALLIGLGLGLTLQSTTRHEGVQTVDMVELAPEVVAAQPRLRHVNGDILRHPSVRLHVDDGRNFLRMNERRWDVIAADPTQPRNAGVGFLYTREYYRSVRDHLTEAGVVCQWMVLYRISPKRLRSAVKTFVEVFPDATLWYINEHAMMVGSRNGSGMLDYARLERKFRQPGVRDDLGSVGIHTPEELLALLLLGPAELRRYLADASGVPVNTDDYPYLEYFVPSDLYVPPATNMAELVRYLVDPTDLVRGQPPSSVARVRDLIRDRAARLMAEVDPHVRRQSGARTPPGSGSTR